VSDVTIERERPSGLGPDGGGATQPHLGWLVAGLSAGAGVIHLAMVPVHADGGLLDPLGFAAVGWFQLAIAAVILTGRDTKRTYLAAAIGNVAILGLWLWSRTVGLPFGNHANTAEDIGAIDAASAAMQVGVVALSARLALADGRRSIGRLAPALVAVGALGLATTVISSSDAASHGHSTETALTGQAALKAEIDADRCDQDFNHPSYWDEAEYLGIDTYQGGAMVAETAGAVSADGHAHGATAAPAVSTSTTEPDPTGGRGSETLDGLVSATSTSDQGEGAAAQLVIRLGEASDEDYDAWLWWLRSTAFLTAHAHSATATDDTGGHGGHVGPQPWVALTDEKDCDQLAEELKVAREVAMTYPTAQDAMDAGWVRVTSYVPGIAAHYMNFGFVDRTFELEKPEMILYDGNEPDAHVVGLSYYILQDGSAEPTQGFTGYNDHGHRHIGLCVGAGGVIGDSTLTAEECAERGGRKSGGSNAWMSHAWVVPGCESPWGVFSAASPVLDKDLGETSGKNDGGCAGSAVRARYGLDDADGSSVAAKTVKAKTASTGSDDESEGASDTTVGGD
jgi:hypothetical protein